MKILSNIYKKAVLSATVVFGLLASSCTDYLTIIPADIVVEENFWQTKDHVNGMLATSYLKLIDRDAVRKAIVWGELRGESLSYSSSKNKEIVDIVEANISDDNSFCQWGIYYEAINYANLVLLRAPQVLERDPDFSEGDLKVVQGEMYAMRALCHFYLVRAFRDIPMALEAAINDSEIPEYKQVKNPLEALNIIMSDLDKAENMVMKSGAFPKEQQNYGRITRDAVLAMKADVNLWRAAFATYYAGKTYDKVYSEGKVTVNPDDVQKYYDECVQNCRDVIANMDEAYNSKKESNSIEYPYNLIQNEGDDTDKKELMISTAYNAIFGTKNSRESIFELQVQGDNVTNGRFNGALSLFGTEGSKGVVCVSPYFIKSEDVGYVEDDLRRYSFTTYVKNPPADVTEFSVAKYTAKESPAKNFRKSDDCDANWIVYRKTDVLLMMAEAMVARPNSNEDDYAESFKIVNAINTRSRMDTVPGNIRFPLKYEQYNNRNDAIKLVRKERLLELAFEGKRWFDLVRLALCEEGGVKNVQYVANKLETNQSVVKARLSSIDVLFFPIHIDELRYNKNLKQNPAYNEDGSSSEMN